MSESAVARSYEDILAHFSYAFFNNRSPAGPASSRKFFDFKAGDMFQLTKPGSKDWWEAKNLANGEVG